jgi:probable HAF family extracellular repeat protein
LGTYSDTSGNEFGFTDTNGNFKTVPAWGQFLSDLGEIVGNSTDNFGRTHAFLYNGGTTTSIDPPGSVSTAVHAINHWGQIVGAYLDQSGVVHGFVATPALLVWQALALTDQHATHFSVGDSSSNVAAGLDALQNTKGHDV